MKEQEVAYQKQEKVFKVLFLVMIMALSVVFYNAFFSESSIASEKSTPISSMSEEPAITSMCVLNKEQKKTVDSMVPALCCLNRKK